MVRYPKPAVATQRVFYRGSQIKNWKNRANRFGRLTMQLATILEPLLIVTMGAVVMLIVLAVMLPIIQLNQFVR